MGIPNGNSNVASRLLLYIPQNWSACPESNYLLNRITASYCIFSVACINEGEVDEEEEEKKGALMAWHCCKWGNYLFSKQRMMLRITHSNFFLHTSIYTCMKKETKRKKKRTENLLRSEWQINVCLQSYGTERKYKFVDLMAYAFFWIWFKWPEIYSWD